MPHSRSIVSRAVFEWCTKKRIKEIEIRFSRFIFFLFINFIKFFPFFFFILVLLMLLCCSIILFNYNFYLAELVPFTLLLAFCKRYKSGEKRSCLVVLKIGGKKVSN